MLDLFLIQLNLFNLLVYFSYLNVEGYKYETAILLCNMELTAIWSCGVQGITPQFHIFATDVQTTILFKILEHHRNCSKLDPANCHFLKPPDETFL